MGLNNDSRSKTITGLYALCSPASQVISSSDVYGPLWTDIGIVWGGV